MPTELLHPRCRAPHAIGIPLSDRRAEVGVRLLLRKEAGLGADLACPLADHGRPDAHLLSERC
jgi:hypothetical protein